MVGLSAEQAKEEPLGLYVHVPFCATTCDFCAFYQEVPSAGSVAEYLDGIVREGGLASWPRRLSTVYWGGGTPGLLAARELAKLAESVKGRSGGSPEEWTVELAPASVTEDRLAVLREAGVTRISLGVQSFQPALLEALGRAHTPSQVRRAYDRIRSAGFANVNLDLMFALPGQSEAEWEGDLAEALALGPEHLSTYCLTFEEDTALWVKLAQGRVRLDPAREERLYRSTWSRLAEAGFEQYEISNFARPGRACRHNLNTWLMHEWIGLGPSAASQQGGWRGANPPDLRLWLSRLGQGERMTQDRIRLTPALRAEDALIFGLRMNQGVDLAAWSEACPDAGWEAAGAIILRLEEEGLAHRAGGRLRLSERGRLLADAIGGELLGVLSGEPAGSPAAQRIPVRT